MIIEIKDLPKDRNVKKISFDIEFEDSVKISSAKESQEYQEPQKTKIIPKIDDFVFNTENTKENSIVPPSIDISKREPKVDEDIMSLEF